MGGMSSGVQRRSRVAKVRSSVTTSWSSAAKWWARVTAVVSTAVLAVLVPATAWASSNGVLDVAYEVARRRPRRGIGGLGLFGGLCCLIVVAIIVLAVVMIRRGRGGGGRGGSGH